MSQLPQSTNPVASVLLRAKLADAKAELERMRKVNKIIHELIGVPARMPAVGHHGGVSGINERVRAARVNLNAVYETYTAKAPLLAARTGLSEFEARAMLWPDYLQEVGYRTADFNRVKAQIRRLASEILTAEEFLEREDEVYEGVTLFRNVAERYLGLRFDEKPSAKDRKMLKAQGFIWAAKETAWLIRLNLDGEKAATRFLEYFGGW